MLLFISCWVPSAICFHLVNNASLKIKDVEFKVRSLSLRQPSNVFGRCHPQTSAKPLRWSPSHSLCCTAYSEHARGSTICLLLLWLERLWSSEFFLFPYLPAAILLSFVTPIHLVRWWKVVFLGCLHSIHRSVRPLNMPRASGSYSNANYSNNKCTVIHTCYQ